VGGGHLTSGQRARGQGGHSPASLLHEELSMITGCCLGILLFNTYLLRSGTGGHSVFNMYLERSGTAGQGGIVAFNTYLLISGSWHGGHVTRSKSVQSDLDFEHLQIAGGFKQRLHVELLNPSLSDRPPRYFPNPKPTPRINTARAKRICGVNFIGITEVIFLFYNKCAKLAFITSNLAKIPGGSLFELECQDLYAWLNAYISFLCIRAS
jgi:hypothetical protein